MERLNRSEEHMASKKPTKKAATNQMPSGDYSVRLEKADFNGTEYVLRCSLFRFPVGKKPIR